MFSRLQVDSFSLSSVDISKLFTIFKKFMALCLLLHREACHVLFENYTPGLVVEA